MNNQYLILILPLNIVVLTSLWFATVAWKRKTAPGATSFAYLMLGIAWWTIAYIFEMFSIDIIQKIFWWKLEFIGILMIPNAFFIFAIKNTQSKRWNNWILHTISGLSSLIFLIIIFSNQNHQWFIKDYSIDFFKDLPVLVLNYGPAFWALVVSIYLHFLFSFIILILPSSSGNKVTRHQIITLIVAASSPILTNLFYIFGFSKNPLIDYTPFAFLITGISIYFGFFKYKLLDISPIARYQLIENMVDGVLVITPDNLIIDINPSLLKILNFSNKEILGNNILKIFEDNPNIKLLIADKRINKTTLTYLENNNPSDYEVKISNLNDKEKGIIGRMLVFHDITHELSIEKARLETEERYQMLVEQSPITVGIHCDNKLVYINKAGLDLFGANHENEILGKNVFTLIHPDYIEMTKDRVKRSYYDRETGGKVEEKFVRLDGQVIDVEVMNQPIEYKGKPASQVIAIDITERKENERKRQRQFKELSVLHLIANLGSETKNEDELIEKATKIIGEVIYTDNFGVLLVENSSLVKEHHTYKRKSKDRNILSFALGEGVTGEVALKGEVIHIPDVSKYDNYIPINSSISSELCVPIKITNKVVGVINAESNEINAFSDDDERFLCTLADQLAIVIEKLRLFNEIQQLAKTDYLTGISNRRHFIELATKEFERSKRYNNSLTAIMIDLDNFKAVNDSFGHAVGDKVLIAATNKIENQLRDIDLFCRYGGEEFAILLPQTDLKNSELIAERLLKAFNQSPIQVSEGSIHLTISIGVATLTSKIIHIDNLLNQADLALYQAKGKGRNKISVIPK